VKLTPSLWASRRPFGIGLQRPNNYFEVLRAAWENRRRPRYTWRILTKGVCDGCALGTTGLHDWTLDGIHLCNVRLRLLGLNTMAAFDPALLGDVAALRDRSGAELRALGRLPVPMVRHPGEPGFTELGWEEALDLIGQRLGATDPARMGVYLTSRGTPNETYYAAQKATRALGCASIDNAARICHSPSTVALKDQLGFGATTCSYTDWLEADLIAFIGSNPANNQPVSMKYLHYARKGGARVAVVNPYREPGMERYWVPSVPESAVFGTRMTDEFYGVDVGGDIAFLTGALKHLIERDGVDREWVGAHTTGWEETERLVGGLAWEELEAGAGLPRAEMERFGRSLAAAKRGVIVWSMGITQHAEGVAAVAAIVNLGLARGWVGRDGCGLMPIRGHSGVQGGAEMGAYATAFPGGESVNATNAARLGEAWGFDVPGEPGMTTAEMLDAAGEGRLDALVSVGGNFLDVMPDPDGARAALEQVGLRVHVDIVLSTQMLVDPAETVVLLPATTRYEVPGGVTETSTERRIIFSPEIEGPRVPAARPEWWIFGELAERARPELAGRVAFSGTPAIRAEIARVVPLYAGIETLAQAGDQVQYGGRHLAAGGIFPTADGRARFAALTPPAPVERNGRLRLVTRRGKQFNSMVQAHRDGLTGADRDAVFLAGDDAARLGIGDGGAVVVRSDHGELGGRAFVAPVRPGTVQVHWPEGNVLIAAGVRSPGSAMPAYEALVDVRAAPA